MHIVSSCVLLAKKRTPSQSNNHQLINQSVNQLTNPSVCLSVSLSVCPSVRPSIHPSIHPSFHPSLYVCLSVFFFLDTSVSIFPFPQELHEGIRKNMPPQSL